MRMLNIVMTDWQETEWSKPIPFDEVGSVGEITLQLKESLLVSKYYSVGYKVDTAIGKFFQTKVVMFLPRIAVVNKVCAFP
jgi:hypothetical protein